MPDRVDTSESEITKSEDSEMVDTDDTDDDSSGATSRTSLVQVRILNGQANWVRWYPLFKADARADDTFELFAGTEVVLVKPTRTRYIEQVTIVEGGDGADASTTLVKTVRTIGPEVARQDLDYKRAIDEYKLDQHDYEQFRLRHSVADESGEVLANMCGTAYTLTIRPLNADLLLLSNIFL
ncbi:hypothetical protein LTR65_003446 [Meristemomyces frigidus]